VAVEADWPDAARIDHYVRHRGAPASGWTALARFPAWMWHNEEIRTFVDWLHIYNEERSYPERAAIYGLDLYSLYFSAERVIGYLETVDDALAAVARTRYGCLSPWEGDPAAYGRAALAGAYRNCEQEVARMLADLLAKEPDFAALGAEQWLDAAQNARLIANAERYYRTMYYGSRAAWNLRDAHMFETLAHVMQHHGPACKAVVWAHNSHVGDAAATEMSARGEVNIGQLCRERFGTESYHIGLGTYGGTVAAAEQWDAPMTVMTVEPAHAQSYERLFHMTGLPGLLLPLRNGARAELRERLERPRLERAIGVVYRPESELASHYFEAVLPRQFDEYIWMDKTSAVEPLAAEEESGPPDTYPFGL
jgi:protein-L-isoaspartate(D-aspartate) O-methyltransferase